VVTLLVDCLLLLLLVGATPLLEPGLPLLLLWLVEEGLKLVPVFYWSEDYTFEVRVVVVVAVVLAVRPTEESFLVTDVLVVTC
jgi:hypothetical protein